MSQIDILTIWCNILEYLSVAYNPDTAFAADSACRRDNGHISYNVVEVRQIKIMDQPTELEIQNNLGAIYHI